MANKKQNAYFEGIRAGLVDIIDSLETGQKLTRRSIRIPEPPPKIGGLEIANLRREKLHLSQDVFASVLDVSLKTVQAWEQDRNEPCGPALRLLWLLAAQPAMLKSILVAPSIAKRGG
jgi:putative transcriptional regulator